MAPSSGAPQTHYATSGELSIAYQTLGDGPIDLVIVPGFVSHLEVLWESPPAAAAYEQLASFSRLILFDKREQGLSDRLGRPPTLEEMADDLGAVLDAVGSERTALLGVSEGGAMAILFAATHPERCSHLALWGTYARVTNGPDYSAGLPEEVFEGWLEILRREWGGPAGLRYFAPSQVDDPETQRWWARLLRSGTSPRGAAGLLSLYREIDVRHALPLISAPTLVLVRRGDVITPPSMGRYIAEHVPGARFRELPGSDHLIVTERVDEVLGEIEEFVTGTRHARPAQRALATVLFTDIVDSTGHAAKLGDRRWREILDRHDDLVRREVESRQGRVVKTTGDGCLATFDGPARAISSAHEIVAEVEDLGIAARAGLHCGECEIRNGDVGGMAVHIGARVAGAAGAGEVLVSRTVKDLVAGSGIVFEDRGGSELKGVPGEWQLYAVAQPG